MRHISLVGNENYILIRFFVTWKIPLPSLTLLTLCLCLRHTYGEISPFPGHGCNLPHKHTWRVTHGLDSQAQGELVVMRWPVVQWNEMRLNVTAHFGIMGGLKGHSAGGRGGRYSCFIHTFIWIHKALHDEKCLSERVVSPTYSFTSLWWYPAR